MELTSAPFSMIRGPRRCRRASRAQASPTGPPPMTMTSSMVLTGPDQERRRSSAIQGPADLQTERQDVFPPTIATQCCPSIIYVIGDRLQAVLAGRCMALRESGERFGLRQFTPSEAARRF